LNQASARFMQFDNRPPEQVGENNSDKIEVLA